MIRLGQNAGNMFQQKGIRDFQREEEEFMARKRARDLAEQQAQMGLEKNRRELLSPQMPFQGSSWDAQIANEAYKFNLSKGMDEASARQNAIDMVQRGKMDYKTVTDPYTGNQTLVTTPRTGIFGSAQPATPSGGAVSPPLSGTNNDKADMRPQNSVAPQGSGLQREENLNQIDQQALQSSAAPPAQDDVPAPSLINPRAFESPDVNMDLAEEFGKQKIQSIFENQKLSDEARQKQHQFEMKLNELIGAYGSLIDRGDFKTELPENATLSDVMRNLSASAQASGPGQTIGGALGTSTATAIEGINTKQPMVFGELRELLGMTGREMDTQKERDFYMNIISQPSTEISTTLEALNALSQRFGTGQSSQRVQDLMNRVGKKKDIRSMSMQEKVQRLKELRAKAGINAN